MRRTWRWFGPKDRVAIRDLRESGVEGVVSALHHFPPGRVWPPDEIARRQDEIGRLPDGSASGIALGGGREPAGLGGDQEAEGRLARASRRLAAVAAASRRSRGRGDLLQLHAGARLDPHRSRLAAALGRHLHALRPHRFRRLRHPYPRPPRRRRGLPARAGRGRRPPPCRDGRGAQGRSWPATWSSACPARPKR